MKFHIRMVCCRRGLNLLPQGKRMSIVPWTDGLLPPAGRRAPRPSFGSPGPGRTRMNDQQAVQSGCAPGTAIQTHSLCAADLGGFRMRKSTDPCPPDGNGLAQRQDCNKEDTNTRPPPPPPFPRALHEFCSRQSPSAAFIEAAESRHDQPDAAPAPHTHVTERHRTKKRSLTSTTSRPERQHRLHDKLACIARPAERPREETSSVGWT